MRSVTSNLALWGTPFRGVKIMSCNRLPCFVINPGFSKRVERPDRILPACAALPRCVQLAPARCCVGGTMLRASIASSESPAALPRSRPHRAKIFTSTSSWRNCLLLAPAHAARLGPAEIPGFAAVKISGARTASFSTQRGKLVPEPARPRPRSNTGPLGQTRLIMQACRFIGENAWPKMVAATQLAKHSTRGAKSSSLGFCRRRMKKVVHAVNAVDKGSDGARTAVQSPANGRRRHRSRIFLK